MNKHTFFFISALFCLCFCSAPLLAEGEDEDTSDLSDKSDQELVQDLLRLFDEVGKNMEELEDSIAKASLPAHKPDEIKATLDAFMEKLQSGELSEVPESLVERFKAEPQELEKLLDLSSEEAKELLEDNNQDQLETKLGAVPQKLEELLKEDDVFNDLLHRQFEIEKKMDSLLKKQNQLGKKAKHNIENALEHAYELRRKSSSKSSGDGQPDQEKQGEQKKQGKGQEEKKNQNNSPGDPSEGAENEYDPPEGKNPDPLRENESRTLSKDIWDVNKLNKEHETTKSGDETTSEPSRYKGFGKQFRKSVGKRSLEQDSNSEKKPSEKND